MAYPSKGSAAKTVVASVRLTEAEAAALRAKYGSVGAALKALTAPHTGRNR